MILRDDGLHKGMSEQSFQFTIVPNPEIWQLDQKSSIFIYHNANSSDQNHGKSPDHLATL